MHLQVVTINPNKERITLISETEKRVFVRWSSVPEHLKTKTQLKQIGLKPIDESNYQAKVRTYQSSVWREFNLYDISLTKPINKRVANLDGIEITPASIAEAIYLINKSAKKSRDTKGVNYSVGHHEVVKRAKTRQIKLYDLKEKALEKCLQDGIAEIKGYHSQTIIRTIQTNEVDSDEICDIVYDRDHVENTVMEDVLFQSEPQEITETITNHFLLINITDYTFHLPINISETENQQYLGLINKIPAEKTRNTSLNFEQAVALLNQLLSQPKPKIS